MFFYEKNSEGAWVVSALVADSETPFNWFEHMQFYGYTKKEAGALFRENLRRRGLRVTA